MKRGARKGHRRAAGVAREWASEVMAGHRMSRIDMLVCRRRVDRADGTMHHARIMHVPSTIDHRSPRHSVGGAPVYLRYMHSVGCGRGCHGREPWMPWSRARNWIVFSDETEALYTNHTKLAALAVTWRADVGAGFVFYNTGSE